MEAHDADMRPPVRAFDAELSRRVAQGLGGVWEARQITALVARLKRYERALRHIAVRGDAASAMLACRTLVGADEV